MAENKKAIEKKFKLSQDNATLAFDKIVEIFGFTIDTETKQKIITMDINNVKMQMTQDLVEAKALILNIMLGKIELDEEKEEIVYILKRPIKTGEGGQIVTKEFRFGQFTRSRQIATKVALNEINFATLPDDKQTKILMAMTGVSDESVFGELKITEFNDLRAIGAYFFN